MSKMTKLVKITKKIYIFKQNSTLYCPNSISDHKYRKFHIRIFPGFSGSGFFPEIFLVRTCTRSNSLPFCSPILLHKLYMQFGLLAEAGRYEKCKKHTFFGFITILEENLFNKNCSQLKNKKFKKKIFSRNSGSGFLSGFYIFRIFRIFCICRMYETLVSKNF